VSALPGLTGAGIGTVDLTGTPGWRYVSNDVWLLTIMPDGSWFQGTGPTAEDAKADARRRWRNWKRGPGPLAVDGREYQRRLRNGRRWKR